MKIYMKTSTLSRLMLLLIFVFTELSLMAIALPPTPPPTPGGTTVGAPTVITQAVNAIDKYTATGNANITNLGYPTATSYGICWGTSTGPTTSNSKVDKGAASVIGVFTASMTGLTAGTTYYVRAFATNPSGTIYGNEVSFTTLAIPVVTWSNPADIVYGTLLGSTQLNATTSVAGTFAYYPPADTKLDAGNSQQLVTVFTPTNASMYATVIDTVLINVRKANPVITWANPSDIIYNTLLSSTQLNATASVTGAFVYNPAATTKLNAGNSQQLVTTFTPTDVANYNSLNDTALINVRKATPVITWANPSDIIYNTLLSSTQLNATANVLGAFVYNPAATTKLNAGNSQQLITTFTPTDVANYNSLNDTVLINVKKATPVITWANPSDIIYNTLLSSTQLNATASITGAFVYNPAATTKLNAGNSQQLVTTFTPTDVANYNSLNDTALINVKKATPVITWANPSDIIYNTLLSSTQLNATASVTGAFVYNPAATTKLNAGNSQQLVTTFTPTDIANYNSLNDTVLINVRKANPVITWANPSDIIYNTLLSSTQLNATASVVGAFVYNPAATTKLNAGNNQQLVTTFTPTEIANYNSLNDTALINVRKATPVITWANPSDIIYNTLLSSTQLNASASVTGAFVYNPAVTTKLTAGNSQQLITTFTPTDVANYNSLNDTALINVRKATPVITWANPSDIIYNTLLSSTQLNATANVLGAFVYNPAATTKLTAGNSQQLISTFTPTDVANYNSLNDTALINVRKATPVITWANPSDIIYNTLLSSTQLNATANVLGAFVYNPAATTKLTAGNSQQLITTFTPTDVANYNSLNDTALINVKKATPVITWVNPSDIIYNTLLSSTQLNATANVLGAFVYNPAATTKLNAGNSQQLVTTFTPSDVANYNAVNDTALINVNKATPVITWANPSDIIYGARLSAIQLNATANVEGAFVYNPAATTKLNAGNSQQLVTTFTPSDVANYNAVNDTALINVNKATPVITWANPSDIIYGALLSAIQLNATANVEGTFVYNPAVFTMLNAGSLQPLVTTFLPTDVANYNIIKDTVTINVRQSSFIVNWNNPSDIAYGTLLSSAQLNATSSIQGNFKYIPDLGTKMLAGENQSLITEFTPLDLINYPIIKDTVFINVNKINPVITWANPSNITYGTLLSADQLNASANISGFFEYSPVLGTKLNAGNVQRLVVTFIPTDAGNYNILKDTAYINVSKATPAISWTNPTDISYGTLLTDIQLNAKANVAGSFVYNPVIGTKLGAGSSKLLITTFTPEDVINYYSISDTVSINIGKSIPVITWNNPSDMVYGTPLSNVQLNASCNIAGSFSYSPASGTLFNVGKNYMLTTIFTPADLNNYIVLKDTVVVNVEKASPAIVWSNPSDITYGTILSSAQLNANSNIQGTFIYSPSIGIKLNGGSSQILLVTFIPFDNTNYYTMTDTALINVNKAVPVISWRDQDAITYGTLLGDIQLNANSNISGQFLYNPAKGSLLNAGNNKKLSVIFTPTDTSNYSIVHDTVYLTVKKAMPVINWENPADILYGKKLDQNELNATSNIEGQFVYNPNWGTVLNAGSGQMLVITLTPSDMDNYFIASDTVLINVYKATGLEKENLSRISIYPNPTTDGFIIDGIEGSSTVSLIDYSGRLVFSKKVLPKEIISLNSVVKGLYFVRIVTTDGEVQKKLIKK